MRQLLKSIISLLVILTPCFGYAQDSLAVKQNNIAMNISVDIGKIGESLLNKQTKWELGVSVLLSQKYQLVAEYGFGSLKPNSVINNGGYTSEGNYYRAGFEYLFTVSPKRYLSLGVMYAHADFNDSGSVKIISDLWDDVDRTFARSDLSANWLEIILNTEAPIFKVEQGFLANFYWGVRFRVRILTSDISQPDFDIFAIPGFGKTYSNVVPAANLYIKYRIDF